MANDLLGGLGGIMKGLSGLMPQDDPDMKLFNVQSEVAELEKQENEIYASIGRQAYEAGPSDYPQGEKLLLVQSNLAAAKEKRDELTREMQAAEQAKEALDAAGNCTSCGHQNPGGMKFCQECGAKLGKLSCVSCGMELAPGIHFCGSCGARQGG